jgi:hypothetical protein
MADKRISQLNSHTSPTGSDLLVIVNNNETKKITYADLIDGIAVDNTAINNFTASYLNDSASFHTRINDATNEQDLTPYVTNIVYGVLSGSVDSRLDNIELHTGSYLTSLPSGLISQSTDLSSLNSFTQSIDSRVDSLESWSSSLTDTFATDLEVAIVSSSVAATIGIISQNTGLVSTSSFNEYTASQSTGSLVDRLNSIENVTSSYELKGSGILSGSISYTDLTNIPDGIVSQSVDIANFTFTTDTITNGAITLQATNSDIVLNADGAVYIGSATPGNGIVTDGYLGLIIGDGDIINTGTGHSITDNLTNILNSIPTIPDGIISGSEQITAFGFISSSQTIDTGSLATTGSNTYNGNQTINGSLTINFSNGIPTGVSNWNGQGGWNQGFYSNLATTGGTGTGLTVDVAAGGGGYIGIEQITINTAGSGYTNGDIITIDNENNLPGTFTIEVGASSFELDASGGLVFPDSTIQTTAFNPTLYATTGSNTFNGNQIISGSLTIASGSSIYGLAQYSGAVLFQPVADPDPLSQATTGTHLFVSSSNNQTGEDLYFRQQDNKVKWKWVEGKLNTGILTGGAISYSGSLVYIKAGTGIIINHNASLNEEISPITTYVSWNDYTASCQNITSSLATYLYVDNVGTIHQTDTYFTVDQYRTSLPLGMVNHTGRNVITSVANNVATAYDDVSQTSDFIRAFGPMKLRGLSITPANNSLKFTIEAGTSYILGGFYQQNPNNSSHKETPLIQTGSLSIARVRRDGSGGFIVDNNSGSFYNSIDSDYWDDGTGVLNTMASGDWQIQRVFFNPFTNRCHIYYGQYGTYSSFINAKQYLASDPFVEADYSSHQYVFIGYLIVKGQTNNLADGNNNLVVQSGLFRNTIGSSGGTQTFTHLHDLADVEVADPSNKDLLSYNSSTALWEHHTFGYLGLATTSSLNGVISGSSQLTSSYDTRYTLSGSVQPLPSGLISGSSQVLGGSGIYSSSAQLPSGLISGSSQLPSGLISGSSQLTASYDTRYTLSGSVISGTTPAGTISGSSQLTSSFDGRYVQTGSFNAFTASALTTGSNSFSGSQNITGSLIVSSVAVVNGAVTIPTGSTISLTSGSNLFVDSSGAITGSLTGSVFGIGDVSAFSSSVNTRLNNITSTPAGTISGSSQLTSSFEVRGSGIYSSSAQLPSGLVSGSTQILGASGIYSSSAQLPSGLISGSSQLPTGLISGSSQILGGSGIYSSSAQLPSGLISGSSQLPSGLVSGSSQLTASYDTRYTLSGSVVSGTTPAGTVSGSSQLTSSYDGRYTLTSSFNSFTASAQAVTTGSNTFNGTQTITGSLNITNGNIVASQITANTASLYLTSGSNLVIQNNGTAEITGSLKVSGSTISLITTTLQIGTGSGDEGGEILLVKSQTNNSLTGSGVTIDSFQNRLRIFEQGGNARGVHIDLTKAPDGVNGELLWKASNIVNAGTFVTLDNIKATVTSSSNRGLSVATVAGTVSGYISGHYQGISGASAGTSSTTSLSTTATTSMFGWNFAAEGDMSTYILRDNTNNRIYRIIMIIGPSYNSNFISIERLY